MIDCWISFVSNVLPRPGCVERLPQEYYMSIGGNSIWQQCHLDSQLSWQGFWFGEISGGMEVSRVEWRHPRRARKEVGCFVSLGYVPQGSEMSSMLFFSSMGRFI